MRQIVGAASTIDTRRKSGNEAPDENRHGLMPPPRDKLFKIVLDAESEGQIALPRGKYLMKSMNYFVQALWSGFVENRVPLESFR